MNRVFRVLLLALVLTGIAFSYKLFDGVTIGPNLHSEETLNTEDNNVEALTKPEIEYVNDTIYTWDDDEFEWIVREEADEYAADLESFIEMANNATEPIDITWKVLMDIDYKLKYFEELDMEVYAPVFSRAVKALDKKEVRLEGYVIPMDELDEALILSYGPWASCFFCGKASPASIISMYMKDKGLRYKLDDFRKFKGTLHLNHDDPNEFYYILKNARE